MIKIKKGLYVYAQLKINNKVKDFYVGKISDYDLYNFSHILKRKVDVYLTDLGVTHCFNNHKTYFGMFLNEEEKITDFKR